MDCEKYEELISGQLDGELTESERRELEAHLRDCPACRALSDTYLEISSALEEDAIVPEGFAEGVMARLPARPAGGRARGRPLARSFAAAACFAVVLLAAGALYLSGGSKSESPQADMAYSGGAAPAEAPKPEPDAGSAPEYGNETQSDGFADGAPPPGEADAEYAEYIEYYAEFHITGALPELLADFTMEPLSDGTFRIVIPREVADALAQLGYAPENTGADAASASVIYTMDN
ncbi:MAG: zf-HC2 domain-containing protein [Oscillospiraceae bacterium]|jgi:hypothetical protein|nr:zf-HC2 domain-containing protein [Oscillospiraceae bacterium]